MKFRACLNENRFIISRGIKQHLCFYEKTSWDKQVEASNKLDVTDSKVRTFLRYFYRGATEITVDKRGNIRVPRPLIEYGRIKMVIVIVIGDIYTEIWDKDIYFNGKTEPNFKDNIK